MSENKDQTATPKRLYRSVVDKMIGGVCGGIAEYFEIDSTVIRVIWLIFTFLGFGIVAYIACLIVMKENPYQNVTERKVSSNTGLIVGIVLVLLGFTFFSSVFHWGYYHFRPYRFRPWFVDWDKFWPIVLILAGILYIYHVLRKQKKQDSYPTTIREETTVIDKKIMRSRKDKMIGGVCSGIAEYFNIDPVLARVLWIFITMFSGIILGVIVYIILLIIIPEEEVFNKSGTEIKNHYSKTSGSEL